MVLTRRSSAEAPESPRNLLETHILKTLHRPTESETEARAQRSEFLTIAPHDSDI